MKNDNREVTLGEVLANILLAAEEGGKMKLFLLAKKFHEGEEVEIDAADLALIKSVVARSKIYSGALVTGQVELLLSEVKE